MKYFAGNNRITFDSRVMGGKPCIRGMRVTVGMILGNFAAGVSQEELLDLYPYLEADDLKAALEYAAWMVSSSNLDIEFSAAS